MSVAMPEGVPVSRRVRNVKVYGHENMVSYLQVSGLFVFVVFQVKIFLLPV